MYATCVGVREHSVCTGLDTPSCPCELLPQEKQPSAPALSECCSPALTTTALNATHTQITYTYNRKKTKILMMIDTNNFQKRCSDLAGNVRAWE